MTKFPLVLTDPIGTKHHFEKVPCRIVSLVPSQTELLVDLGLETELVGITKFCVHPSHLLKTKTIIGGTKKVNFQKIAALKPDIIIANKEENTPEMVAELSKICAVWVCNTRNSADLLKMIVDLGQIFNLPKNATIWIEKIRSAQHNFEQFMIDKSFKKVAYLIWANPYMVAANETFINEMLVLNKFENVFQNQNRYPEVTLKQLASKNPDLILLSSEPFPFQEKQLREIQQFSNAKIIFVNGELFSWHASRIVIAFDYFKTLHSKF